MKKGFYLIALLIAAGAFILSARLTSDPSFQTSVDVDASPGSTQPTSNSLENIRERAANGTLPEDRFIITSQRAGGPASGPPGVSYASLEQQDLPDEVREKLGTAAKALKETGSLSGGRRTHEFAYVDHFAQQLREKGWANLMRDLAITPTDLAVALGQGFLLVGADVQGKDIDKLGRAGFFQVYRANSDRWAELSEEQLDGLTGDGTVISTEMLNDTVGSYPATVEQLMDDAALLVNVEWVVNERLMSLSTRNMPKEQALALALRVSQSVEAMPHRGWRAAYEYDDDNPLHRVTRARLQQQGERAVANGQR